MTFSQSNMSQTQLRKDGDLYARPFDYATAQCVETVVLVNLLQKDGKEFTLMI